MTTTLGAPSDRAPGGHNPLSRSRLGALQHAGIGLAAVAIGILATVALGGFRWGWALMLAAISYVVLIYVVARRFEDRRQATDRLATAVMTMAFVLVLFPLVSVAWTVISKGSARFDATFFSDTMRLTPEQLLAQNEGAEVGGAIHAVYGTLMVTGLAAALSVPFGLFTAIYLVEYGRGRLARWITAMVDVMTGIPSIVAGLFAYALFVLVFGPGTRSGIAGAVALTVLMTPVVIRSAEEILRLVPDELREASLALGVPKWKTIVKIVIPTAIAGILTGVTLAIARVIGETAPLLVTAGLAQDTNLNPFSGRMSTLPVYTYQLYKFPTLPPQASIDRAWAAALTLVVIVGILFTIARVIATILKPKGLR
jgi:phosphate transport system permease protein